MDHYNDKMDRWLDRYFWVFWVVGGIFTALFWTLVVWLLIVLIQHFS